VYGVPSPYQAVYNSETEAYGTLANQEIERTVNPRRVSLPKTPSGRETRGGRNKPQQAGEEQRPTFSTQMAGGGI